MTNQKTCLGCGQLLPDGAQFCPQCGTWATSDARRPCPRCGQVSSGPARFCAGCGTSLITPLVAGEPVPTPSTTGAPTSPKPAWGQLAAGGLGGLLLGSLLGGGRGPFGGYGSGGDGEDVGGSDGGGGGE